MKKHNESQTPDQRRAAKNAELRERQVLFASILAATLDTCLSGWVMRKHLTANGERITYEDLKLGFSDYKKMICETLERVEKDHRVTIERSLESLPIGNQVTAVQALPVVGIDVVPEPANSRDVSEPWPTLQTLDEAVAYADELDRNGHPIQSQAIACWALNKFKSEIASREVEARRGS